VAGDAVLKHVGVFLCSEQVLHLWLETLCSCVEVVEKWYQPWSFMRSPGWVQIKCELRSASAFLLTISTSRCLLHVYFLAGFLVFLLSLECLIFVFF